MRGARLVALCDVRTSFTDAAARFGPQKGADAAAVRRLTRRLERLAATWPRDPRGVPMTGAAGGLAGALWAVLGAELKPGARFILDALDSGARMRAARAVIVGEGRLDPTTLEGKAAGELATDARQAGVPCHAIVGSAALGRVRAADHRPADRARGRDGRGPRARGGAARAVGGPLMPAREPSAVIVGGGHNGLVAATLLAQAGVRTTVLERLEHFGGAAVSEYAFPGVDVRLSRYAYLVSLFPRELARRLGIDLPLIRRRISSYTPDGDRGLLIDDGDAARTAASMLAATGDPGAHDAWRRLYADTGRLARALAPTLLEPLPTRAAARALVGDDALWDAFIERPLGDTLDAALPTTSRAASRSPTAWSARSPTRTTRRCSRTAASSTT